MATVGMLKKKKKEEIITRYHIFSGFISAIAKIAAQFLEIWLSLNLNPQVKINLFTTNVHRSLH